MKNPFKGMGAIFYKEVRHMRRDRMAVIFALMLPIGLMTILGGAIDTNIRQVKTVIYDASGSSIVNRQPRSVASTLSAPPCACTSPLAIANPSPLRPARPSCCVELTSATSCLSRLRSWPPQLSSIDTDAQVLSVPTVTSIVPPLSV